MQSQGVIAVAPPGDLSGNARPRLEEIVAFRAPGQRLIKLHVGTILFSMSACS